MEIFNEESVIKENITIVGKSEEIEKDIKNMNNIKENIENEIVNINNTYDKVYKEITEGCIRKHEQLAYWNYIVFIQKLVLIDFYFFDSFN